MGGNRSPSTPRLNLLLTSCITQAGTPPHILSKDGFLPRIFSNEGYVPIILDVMLIFNTNLTPRRAERDKRRL